MGTQWVKKQKQKTNYTTHQTTYTTTKELTTSFTFGSDFDHFNVVFDNKTYISSWMFNFNVHFD